MIKVLAWNVEHFKGTRTRIGKVVDHIKAQGPDIFGILEVKRANVRSLMEDHFPGYDFALTDGRQVQEILIGWRRSKFQAAAFSQKREFKAYNPSLRPGALLSVRRGGKYLNVLFLHTDSGTKASDFGNRHEMFEHIFKLKRKLDRMAPDNDGNLITIGDLNLMGLRYPTGRRRDELVEGDDEISSLSSFARSHGLTLLNKSHDETFNNGRGLRSDLDHALVSRSLALKVLGNREIRGRATDYHVHVEGWNQLSGSRRRNFIDNISDHSSIRLEVDV